MKFILFFLFLLLIPLPSIFGEFRYDVIISDEGFNPKEQYVGIINNYKVDFNYFVLDDPQFCILESDYNDVIIQSILEWDNSLKKYTNNRDIWNFNYEVINYNNTSNIQCEIIIDFSNITNDKMVGGDTFGQIEYDGSLKTIKIYNIPKQSEILKSILLHEIGHSIGLGHYITNNENLSFQWNGGLNIPSLMIKSIEDDVILKITDFDLEKVVEIYGEDGFGGNVGIYGDVTHENESIPNVITPEWIDIVYEWYYENMITHTDLYNIIEYMLKKGIVVYT